MALEILDFNEYKSRVSPTLKVFSYDKTDSTNLRAREYLQTHKPEKAVFIAKEQTAGKGRHGKKFFSPEYGLYISFLLPAEEIVKTELITTKTAVCVCNAIEALTSLKPKIKWVNDIFLDGKKVAGILCEAVNGKDLKSPVGIIIGIGINFKSDLSKFPDELKKTSTVLFDKSCECSATELAVKLTEEIFDRLNNATIDEYRKRCFVINREISYVKNGEKHLATVIGIDEAAGLTVSENGVITVLTSGEISIKI